MVGVHSDIEADEEARRRLARPCRWIQRAVAHAKAREPKAGAREITGSGSPSVRGVGPTTAPNAASIAAASKKRDSSESKTFSYSRANADAGIARLSLSRSACEICRHSSTLASIFSQSRWLPSAQML